MANDLLVPILGPGRGEGTLIGWYHEDGDEVRAGDLVCCFEAGNVAVDIEAPGDGFLWHEAAAGMPARWGEAVGVILAPGEVPTPRDDAAPVALYPAQAHDPEAASEPPPAAAPHYAFEAYEVHPVEDEPEAAAPVSPTELPLLRRTHTAEEPAALWGSAPGDQTEFDSPLLWRSASEAWPWGRDDDGQPRRRRLLPLGPTAGSHDDDAPTAASSYDDWEDDPRAAVSDEWEPATPTRDEGDEDDAAGNTTAGWLANAEAPVTPTEDRGHDAPPPPMSWEFTAAPAASTWSEPAPAPEPVFEEGDWAVVAEPAEWDTPAPEAWPPAPATAFAWDAPAADSLAASAPAWVADPGPAAPDEPGEWTGELETIDDEPEPAVFEMRGDVVEPWDDPAGNVDPAPLAAALPVRPAALWLRTELPAAGLAEVEHRLGTEWGAPGPSAAVLVAAAIARALAESGTPGADILLDTPGRPETHRAILRAAGERPMRELVDDATSRCPHDALFDCAFTDFGPAGIDEGIPPLGEGQGFALAAGALRDTFALVAGRATLAPVLTLTLSYDPALVSPGDAAWFLARVRALCEAPHALLAA
ncbi:MAG: hypothetical protein IT302_08260 [Dehalococcoidia bacterium]|nr:hypothetical protein [Dehalococcoidia bacterium]